MRLKNHISRDVIPGHFERRGLLILSPQAAWHLQKLLYERTVRDLTDRIDAIRQGNADIGHVAGQEARDIFDGKQVTNLLHPASPKQR